MSKSVSMRKFPFNKRRRATWISFVPQKHRPNWTPTGTSILCSAHFLETDYNQRVDIDVPEVQGCSTGSIKFKKFLNLMPKLFQQSTTSKLLAKHSQKMQVQMCLRAKRRLLRDVHVHPSLLREVHFKTMKC
jgi:hypothetical protein